MRVTPHQHQLARGEAVGVGRNLRNQGQRGRDFPGRLGLEVHAFQPDFAFLRIEHARDGAEKRGLPRTIRTDQTDQLPVIGFQFHAIQERLGFDAEADVVCLKSRVCVGPHHRLLR